MTALGESYDVLFLDLDGTVYRGDAAIPGARQALSDVSARQYFVTNNASRTPATVADHLIDLGFHAPVDAVVTSAQSAARLVAEMVDPGSVVLVVGTEALAEEIRLVGLEPVRRFADAPVAVVQGLTKDVNWEMLAEAALAIRAGTVWVASNVDTTLPTERGLLPGNGAIVAALRAATGREPHIAGKPARPIMDDAVRRSGGRRPLVVGDRLDTDIEAAHALGADSLLVLTGVSTAWDVINAPAHRRPTYIGADLRALHQSPAELRIGPRPAWHVESDGDDVIVEACADAADVLDGLRAVADTAWRIGDLVRLVPRGEAAHRMVTGWR
ncbi:HAD-IIA family hydrolase [Speluncibacter jeojiensis]|uniref:HAD-IIA family hydrolase n=1 Tax=Speluncibacter jeojiensis TaxID=2710754 RepID=A0A9X4M280_9ACTN|nr:HAD-IIA family hydrolase [Corynebacteriales bacterium D3-21]